MQFGNDTSVVANAPAWFELQEFKIFSVSGGNRVYRNGRQQLKVRVVVAVADAFHRRVPLTQSELDSIVLVDASSGLPLSKKTDTARRVPMYGSTWSSKIVDFANCLTTALCLVRYRRDRSSM